MFVIGMNSEVGEKYLGLGDAVCPSVSQSVRVKSQTAVWSHVDLCG